MAKKFAAFYAVLVKYGNWVTFTGSFHPRPELYVNGEAGLDGEYCLDGFLDSREDLYPVVFFVYGDILQQTRHAARYRLQTETRETVYHGLQICIHGDAGKQAGSESSACISASAKENIATGERLVIEKDLWYLDGEQMLDGSVCLDADIYEEPL